jgi:predicted component of type VI protein secretion system
MQLFLTGTVGDRQSVWPIEGEAMRIGRSSRNAIPLPDGTVSKEHAELKFISGRWYVRDLGSRNGTRVNGTEAVDPIEIKLGDRIEIGHVFLNVTGDTPSQRVRFDESTAMNSSLRIRADQILERKTDKPSRSIDTVKLLSEAGRLLVLPRPLTDTCDELLAFVERAIPASRYLIILQSDPKAEPQQVAARTRKGRADEPLAPAKAVLPTLRGRRRSATRRSSRIKGISSSERHVATANLPPLARARRISDAATGLSGKNCSPCWHTTTSNCSPSRRGSALACPSRQSMLDATARATESISELTSIPTTCPASPSRSLATRATIPVPHATSRTRSP